MSIPVLNPFDPFTFFLYGASSGSGGTALPLLDFSVPDNPSGKNLWTGNYIVAKVGGQKLMLTSQELQQLLDNGVDVEIVTPGIGGG